MDVIKEIVKFNTDRGLHKTSYDAINAHANIIEELLESIGLSIETSEQRERLKEEIVSFVEFLKDKGIAEQRFESAGKTPIEEVIDAYSDTAVFAIGEILRLGCNPSAVLAETVKEINSRAGEFTDGKFQKDKSPEARANWYKADYRGCRIED